MSNEEMTLREVLLAESYQREIDALKAEVVRLKTYAESIEWAKNERAEVAERERDELCERLTQWDDNDKTCGELSCDECNERFLRMKERLNSASQLIAAHLQTFADLNNCADAARKDALTAAMQQSYRDLRDWEDV